MDPINSLNSVVYILREKFAHEASRVSKEKRTGRATSGSLTTKQRPTTAELQQVLRSRLSVLEESSGKDAQAVLTFVEVILVWEFGEDILQDAGLDALTREVAAVLESDPAVHRALMGLLHDLSK